MPDVGIQRPQRLPESDASICRPTAPRLTASAKYRFLSKQHAKCPTQ